MATLKVIRKRITSVKNTQKITKAMKMVSAARLRRAQTALLQGRPYEKYLLELIQRLALRIDPESSPYLRSQTSPAPAMMVFTSDRGLCGGFNSNLLRRVQYHLNFEMKEYSKTDLLVIGRRGRDFFRSRKIGTKKEWTGMSDRPVFSKSMEMASEILKGYDAGEFGAFYLAYNGFKSAISQEIRIRKI